MAAPCESETPVDQIMPPAKRHYGHHFLVVINFPEAVFTNPTLIRDFFLPIPVKSFDYAFPNPTGLPVKRTWGVSFLSEQDMDKAFMERQWQVKK